MCQRYVEAVQSDSFLLLPGAVLSAQGTGERGKRCIVCSEVSLVPTDPIELNGNE